MPKFTRNTRKRITTFQIIREEQNSAPPDAPAPIAPANPTSTAQVLSILAGLIQLGRALL